jgi:DHA1 family multidrug resistance protein-like MFS transporter
VVTGRTIDWRQNLAFVWLSQFFSIMGFSFALPFAPYYIQHLGVTDPDSLKLWVSAFAAATPLSLALSQPIWGAAADRFGRRRMLVRANLAGSLVLLLMASVRSVEALVMLRLVQGAFTGTVSAAQTLVAANTPSERNGLALGALSAAVFSGAMTGAFLGGWFADIFGYRATFYAAAGLILLASLLVLLFTREDFTPPSQDEQEPIPPRFSLRDLGAGLPILALIAAMAGVRQFDMALVPLLVQDLHGGVEGVSRWTGMLFAVASIGGLLAGPTLGLLADRTSPARIAKICSIGAAGMMLVQGMARVFMVLVPARFGMMFCAGGLDPVFQIWLAKVTPKERRGVVFGWSSTARSLGWFAAPLLSGALATVTGLRSIYFINAALFLLLIPLINHVVKRVARQN